MGHKQQEANQDSHARSSKQRSTVARVDHPPAGLQPSAPISYQPDGFLPEEHPLEQIKGHKI